MLTINDIQAGKSYACKFKIKTLLDRGGEPSTKLSENSDIKDYESFGVIQQRDMQNKLLTIIDQKTNIKFVVDFDSVWDIDTVEWIHD
jgi:hypothetical protein